MNKKQNLIPHEFITTKGSGCSDYTLHAGSYHIALSEANICDYNIQTYSSVIPATAKQVSLDDVDMPQFGSELRCIMARADGYYGEHISCGIIWAWLYKDEDMTERVGGLVCELGGYFSVEELEKRLYIIHDDLYKRTYSNYVVGEPVVITESLTIDKRYGTALVSLCFLNYL
jgi:arginine decarboxylase